MNTTKQEKIYIEIDEEITNVIDHIHQIKSNDIVLIVPQRALLLQSVVNLKLMAQEAKKYHKKITLMTRDEDGIAFAARAGVAVQPYVTEEHESLQYENNILPQKIKEENIPQHAQKIMNKLPEQRGQSGIGSQAFFNGAPSVAGIVASDSLTQGNVIKQKQEKQIKEKEVQMDMMPINGVTTQTNVSNSMNEELDVNVDTNKNPISQNLMIAQKEYETQNNVQQKFRKQGEIVSLDEYEQTLRGAQVSGVHTSQQQQNIKQNNNDFKGQYEQSTQIKTSKSKNVKHQKKQKKKQKDVKVSQTTNNLVKGFVIGGIILITIIFLVIFLPKTKINIQPKEIDINETIELTAKVDQNVQDSERRLIPARLIERDITYTKSFDATGSGDVTAQKAQGTITVFNEYSTTPQPLVATTRFLAEDGTLFRLVNQITVPGMKGDEPGKIDALVEADVAGASGNIGATHFSIPGFTSDSKKDKFYGISDKSMTGGGTGGTGVTLVTEDDITSAKVEMTKEMPQYIEGQIIGLLRPEDEIALPEARIVEEIRSEANVGVGTMSEQFMYEIVSHVKVLVFSEDDVLAIMESNLEDKGQQYDTEQVETEIKYNNVIADFEKQTLEMKAYGTASVVATVDVKGFQEDITGQKHDELLTIMEEKYVNEIDKITIESVTPSFPAFIANRISKFPFMTEITVEKVLGNESSE